MMQDFVLQKADDLANMNNLILESADAWKVKTVLFIDTKRQRVIS